MAETPQTMQGNTSEARTETGALIDQKGTNLATELVPTAKDTSTGTETAKTETSEEGKTLLGKDGEKTEKVEAKAPEKYEFKAPTGWDKKGWELNTELIDKAVPIFKEMGLSNEQAQKLVDFYAAQSATEHEASVNSVLEQQKQWRQSVISDPALGDGKGLKSEVKANIANVIDTHMGPAAAKFREALDFTGAGDNPDIIRGLNALSARLGEGTQVKGNGPSAFGQRAPGSPARPGAAAMYPKLPSATG